MEALFKDKTVFLTGAYGGLGQAIAQEFYRQGAQLWLSGRDETRLEALATHLAQQNPHGASCKIYPLDLEDNAALQSTIEKIEEAGGVDILINNAGLKRDKLSMRISDDDWSQVLNVNLSSGFYLARGLIKSMMRKRFGRIINISSVVACIGNAGQSNYVASKAGMIGWTKAMAQEIASRNITVNAVAPGYIETDMTKGISEEAIKARIPCGRYGKPEEVAHCVSFLAHPGSSYVTGSVLHVNGGLVMI